MFTRIVKMEFKSDKVPNFLKVLNLLKKKFELLMDVRI